ncbi:MAG: extracellular solute-binding protein [Lachnospiraceae bacterium]|nr:extracellular solute-binding protein [Lachnospiraceae bacterium]
MKRGNAKKVVALSIAVCMAVTTAVTAHPAMQLRAQESGQTTQGTVTETYSNERLDNGYTKVSAGYTLAAYTGEPILYGISTVYQSGDASLTTEYGYSSDAGAEALSIPEKGKVDLEIDVPQSAVYYMSFDYLANSESILPVEAGIMINGAYPFYEMRQQKLESQWTAKPDKVYDSYGNEVVSMPDKVYDWQNKYVQDSTYRYSQPLGIELQQGKNTVTIELNEGTLVLGMVSLTAKPQVAEYTGSEVAAGDGFIEIQAEDFLYRNDSAIHATCEYDPDLYPYQAGNRVMNTVDATSFSEGGQEVTYSFTAEKAGNYYIAFHYSQGDKADFPVFMNVKIDGTLPNTAFENHAFAYEKKYEMYTMVDSDGNKISIPLEAGNHTISMQISMEPLRESLETIEKIMGRVNDLSLEVTKVAGTNKDKYRDFSLEAYLPGIGGTMTEWADELNQVMENAKVYNPKKNKIAAYASVKIAENQLRSLAKKPDELIYRIDELATSTSSVNQHLANLIDSLNGNDFSLDSIYLYQEDAAKQLPKNKNIFTKMWLGIVRFFTSFGEQAYSSSNTNPEHLQVSVNRSRQHLEIMQLMINEQFTPQTGIEVDLSLMPDQTKLVLANASGDSPDVATGVNYSIPFELGIRGALKDLTEFDDFAEIAERYNAGLIMPYVIGDRIYALPETMNFQVMFYRKDILDKLGLGIPDTLEEVEAMLPDLQMRGLNFYYPTARTVGMKTFLDTTPILFQSGGNLYNGTVDQAVLTSEENVEGFTTLTNLFTIYNLPKDVPNFYQHFRNGDYPIGISDFGNYNLISNAAPEIEGSWGVALIPGVKNEDGEVMRYSSAGAESTFLFESTPEREQMAWEFVKWWSSAEVQAEFGQRLQITYGDEYYWNTANAEAFAQLPWDSDDKAVILEQLEWTLEAPRALASYMVERELSDAYNLVVLGEKSASVRESLDDAQKSVKRETQRKLEEFGYIENGVTVQEYEVPTVEKVREIIAKSKEAK